MSTRSNVIWSISGNLAKIVSQALYFVIIARILGPQQYGVFSSLFAFINLFAPFSTLGYGNVMVMDVSRNRRNFSVSFGRCIVAVVVFGSFLTVLVSVLGFLLYGRSIVYICISLSLAELVFFRFIDISSQAFQSHEDMKRASGVYLLSAAIRLCLAGVAYILHIDSLRYWIILYLFSNVFVAALCLYVCIMRLGKPSFAFTNLLDRVSQGLPYTLGITSTSIYTDIDKVFLLRYVDPSLVGEYSAAYRFIIVAVSPLQSLVYALNTRMFREGSGGLSQLLSISRKLTVYIFGAFIIIALIYSLLSSEISRLLGDEYRDVGLMLLFMIPLILLSPLNMLIGDILMGAGYQSSRSKIQMVAAIFALVLSFLLIPVYGWKGGIIVLVTTQILLFLGLTLLFRGIMRKERYE